MNYEFRLRREPKQSAPASLCVNRAHTAVDWHRRHGYVLGIMCAGLALDEFKLFGCAMLILWQRPRIPFRFK